MSVARQIEWHHRIKWGSLTSMARVHFHDLHPKQREMISNGCGPRGWGVLVPDFGFTKACDEHDFLYWRGGTPEERLQADQQLRDDMLIDARGYRNPFRTWFRYGLAWTYYLFNRLFGWTRWDRVPGNARTLLTDTLEYYK